MEINTKAKLKLKGIFCCIALLLLTFFSVFHVVNKVNSDELDNILLSSSYIASAKRSSGDKDTTQVPSTSDITTEITTTGSSPARTSKTSVKLSSTTKSTTTITTTMEPLPCSERDFPLATVCPLTEKQQKNYLGKDVLLEELADTFYNSIVLDALVNSCKNGTWCLSYNLDNDLLLGDHQVYMQYCNLDDCLSDISDECMTPVSQIFLVILMFFYSYCT